MHCGFQVYIPYLQSVTARVPTNMKRSYEAHDGYARARINATVQPLQHGGPRSAGGRAPPSVAAEAVSGFMLTAQAAGSSDNAGPG